MERDKKSLTYKLISTLMHSNDAIQINLYCNERDREEDNYVFMYSEKHGRKSTLIDEMRRNNDRD